VTGEGALKGRDSASETVLRKSNRVNETERAMSRLIGSDDQERIEDLERRLIAHERASRLIDSSIRDGLLEIHDANGVARVQLAKSSHSAS
jgi:hypothetical protein